MSDAIHTEMQRYLSACSEGNMHKAHVHFLAYKRLCNANNTTSEAVKARLASMH